MSFVRSILPAAALIGISSLPSAAQVPDSARREIDPPSLGFDQPRRGMPLTDSLPARLPFLTLAELAARAPASFTYLFGTPGWPDAVSFWGLPPRATTLLFNETPFTHVFTGRPAGDLVPIAFVDAPSVDFDRHGRPVAMSARLRDFDSPRPLTEGRYWKGGEGLQSIDVVHVQNRRRTAFRRPGLLNIMGAYSGRAATGEYPGSALRRGRQLHVRGRYAQQNWSLELLNVHNRRRVGAHGGVIPDDDFNSIYLRTGALVHNQEAERRLIRNDLSTTFRFRALGSVTSLSGFWTSETFRYRDAGDTLHTNSDRVGARVSQPLLGLSANLEGWLDAVSHPRGRETRESVHAWMADSLRVLGWDTQLTAGAHLVGGSFYPGASLVAARRLGSISGFVSGLLSGDPFSAVDRAGFGTLIGGAESGGRFVLVRAGVGYADGALDATVSTYFSLLSDPTDYYVSGVDSAAVLTASAGLVRAGAYADLGWRRKAERGFYLTMRPSVSQVLNADESPLHRRSADALPMIFGMGRLGMRYLLFRGDLDLDAYVEASAWSTFRSRTLHAQSGLLVIPEKGARVFGPSSLVDVVIEAGIRDAKVFVMYRNALSGTGLQAGNLLVPNYPLPAREVRIGVYWPILD